MAHLITHPSAVDFLAQTDGQASLNELLAELDIQIQELPIQDSLVGGTIGDVEVRGKGTFIIVALRRATGEVIVHPQRNLYLAKDDTLMLMGHQGDMPNFAQQAALKREMRYRGARVRH